MRVLVFLQRFWRHINRGTHVDIIWLFIRQTRKPKIANFPFIVHLASKYVAGFEIPVQYFLSDEVLVPLGNLAHNVESLAFRDFAFALGNKMTEIAA
jgi:hypothetical protein